MQYKLKLKPAQILTNWGIEYKDKGKELQMKCLVNNCDLDKNKARFYVDSNTGQYTCHRCNSTGNLVTIAKKLNKEIDFFEKEESFKNVKLNKQEPTQKDLKELPLLNNEAENYHNNLSDETIKYLHQRGLFDSTIKDSILGETIYKNTHRITIPVFDKDKNVISIKYRIYPGDEASTDAKYLCTVGAQASLYGIDQLSSADKDRVVICEGEFDSLILRQWGYTAVTSTNGAGTFKEEWVQEFNDFSKIYLCFDNDDAGKTTVLEHAKKFKNKNVFIVNLPTEAGVKDITDYKVKAKKNKNDFEKLLKSAVEYNPHKAEFRHIVFGNAMKEFIPSQYFDNNEVFITIPLNIINDKESKSPYYTINSKRELYTLEEIKESFDYVISRYPDFQQRWSPDSVSSFLKGQKIEINYKEILDEIINIFREYLDLSNENWYITISLWIWGTYFYRIFSSYPYFNINGLMSSGKSKMLELGSLLAFNGEFLVTSTPAYVISAVHDNCSTLFLDEVEDLKIALTPDTQTMIQMLNSGYKKGAKKGKKEISGNGKGWTSIKLDPYSPKMMAGIKNISNTLISRSLNLTMVASENKTIRNREIDENSEVFQHLRDHLYLSIFDLFTDVITAYKEITEEEIHGRNWEIWKPLFALALVIDARSNNIHTPVYNQIRHFALESTQRQDNLNAENQIAIQMLVAFKEMMGRNDSSECFYTTAELKDYLLFNYEDMFDWLAEMKTSGASRYIGDQLRKTGVIEGAADVRKINGKTGRGYVLNKENLIKRLRAYGREEIIVTL